MTLAPRQITKEIQPVDKAARCECFNRLEVEVSKAAMPGGDSQRWCAEGCGEGGERCTRDGDGSGWLHKVEEISIVLAVGDDDSVFARDDDGVASEVDAEAELGEVRDGDEVFADVWTIEDVAEGDCMWAPIAIQHRDDD
jgi:hypothetical protein